jgi:Kyakuja-Dileera-Zisupton transposase
MTALLISKVCDRTGVGAMACARHGCFVPNALVDFFEGEQQKNMDFAFLQALKVFDIDPDQGALLIYDISCQYTVHFMERIGKLLPQGLTVEAAIGLFHVHAHKDSCFFRYATSFIPGAGIVIGEILESLWSNLNTISHSARTATLAHRSEILDDHACDSNHKKTVAMRTSLCKRFNTATHIYAETLQYFQDVDQAAGPLLTVGWERDIREAEDLRRHNIANSMSGRPRDLACMDIYAAKLSTQTDQVSNIDTAVFRSPIEKWMDFALNFEQKQ